MNQEEINYIRKYYGRFMGYREEGAPTMEEEDWNNLVDSADTVMEKIAQTGERER